MTQNFAALFKKINKGFDKPSGPDQMHGNYNDK